MTFIAIWIVKPYFMEYHLKCGEFVMDVVSILLPIYIHSDNNVNSHPSVAMLPLRG